MGWVGCVAEVCTLCLWDAVLLMWRAEEEEGGSREGRGHPPDFPLQPDQHTGDIQSMPGGMQERGVHR